MSQIPDPTNLCFQSNEQPTTILTDCVRRLSLGPTTAELHCSASLLTVRPPTATRRSNSQSMSRPHHTSAKIEEVDDVDTDILRPIPVPETCYHSTRSSIHSEPGDQAEFVAGASGGDLGDPGDPSDDDDDGNTGDDANRPDPALPRDSQPQGGGGGPPNPPGGGPDPGPPSNPDDFDDDNYINQDLDIVRAGDLQEALNNIAAILESQQLIQTQQIAKHIKVKEPKTFDGSTLEYFQPFLEFGDEAIDEFEFFHDWGNFVQALTNAFGMIAPEDDAETALMDLTFGENG
ncbi:hypothetical protein Clacol_004563 [Clathrus columnatus]|uniref:Uncharacterized protein n=1 Tax=Clathrus columnatus TaxID=1419009 RepID=A0AAV5A6U5_9AGAM|nr:hypothetical protein Clacol_004563 [Clathrus columnatus]